MIDRIFLAKSIFVFVLFSLPFCCPSMCASPQAQFHAPQTRGTLHRILLSVDCIRHTCRGKVIAFAVCWSIYLLCFCSRVCLLKRLWCRVGDQVECRSVSYAAISSIEFQLVMGQLRNARVTQLRFCVVTLSFSFFFKIRIPRNLCSKVLCFLFSPFQNPNYLVMPWSDFPMHSRGKTWPPQTVPTSYIIFALLGALT